MMQINTEITRKSVLIECLQIMRGQLKLLSTGDNTLIPKKGMEDQYFDQRKKCAILEDLIHAYETEAVRKALNDWQMKIIREDAAGKPHQLTI